MNWKCVDIVKAKNMAPKIVSYQRNATFVEQKATDFVIVPMPTLIKQNNRIIEKWKI